MGVAKLLAREAKEASGEAVVMLSTNTVDLFAAEANLPDVPEWIELIPAPLPDADDGHVETRDWRPGFICDPKKIVDAFNAKPRHRRAAPIDWEHKGHRNWFSERNPAAAWIEELKVGEDGESVWGRIDPWTPEGRSDVANRRYRYISPVVAILWPADSEGNIDWDAVPIATELIDAALTNNPATYIRDLARTPVGDSDEDESENSSAGAGALAASVAPPRVSTGGRTQDDEDMQFSKELLTKLGLPEDATKEQVEQAMLTSLSSSSAPVPATPKPEPAGAALFTKDDLVAAVDAAIAAKVEPLERELQELRSDKKDTAAQLLSTQVNVVVDSAIAAFRATPAMRDGLVELGLKGGIEALRKHVESLPSLEHLSQSAGRAQSPSAPAPLQLSEADRKVCEQLEIDPEKYAVTLRTLNKDKDAA